MNNRQAVAMLGAILAGLFMAHSAALGGDRTLQVSYLPSIIGGTACAAFFAIFAGRAWCADPPSEMIAWVFGHLAVLSGAFAIEEAGWMIWRHIQLIGLQSAWLPLIEYTLAPALKVVQGVAFLGMLGFAVMSHRGLTGAALTFRIRLLWAFGFLITALAFTAARLLGR